MILRFPQMTGMDDFISDLSPGQKFLVIAASIIARLLFAIPLVVAVLNGMAWWKIKNGKPSGRGWAIAASLSLIFSSVLLLLPMREMSKYSSVGIDLGLLFICGALIVIGVLGLVAFARRDAMSQSIEASTPPRIAGDGTRKWLDVMVWMLGIAGYLWVISLWHTWGVEHHLPKANVGLLQLFAIFIIVITLHEFGHAATGLALGMRLRTFIVGPLQWHIRDGRWTFQFLPARFLSAGGGATALVPTNPHQSVGSQICMIAAGPVVNLLTGLIALYAALSAQGQSYEKHWGFFAYFATISLLVFTSNLVPMRPEAHYSDGARIYQLLRGGPLSDYQRASTFATASSVTNLRSRDYDIGAIQRAAGYFTQGYTAVFLHLVASEYFLDNGRISEAREAFEKAESTAEKFVSEIPVESYPELVFGNAFLCRDAAAARVWWDRMETHQAIHINVPYWLAISSLFWIEGQKEEALEAWNKGNTLAQKLPSFGGNEFERYRLSLLHDCIEKEAASTAND